jgi:phosphate transport system substrate-binding protein
MKHYLSSVLLGAALLSACQNQSSPSQTTYISGEISVVADETFAPIIEDQAYVFESLYDKSKINRVYKTENEVLNLFLNDSIRVAILSRELSPEESKRYENKNIRLRVNRFAIDGIALVTERTNPDSLVTVAQVISVMRGENSRIKSLVFDNPNSSTVRYMKELAGIKLLPSKGVYALKSNQDVIRYVNENPGSIGVIGVNWIRQPEKDMEEIVGNLRIMGVKGLPGKPGADAYYRPNQNDLAMEVYPLTRNLYIIDGEGRPGLGTGFASFIAGETGQRIVLKSGLLPDSIPSRQVIINQKINN